MLREKPEAQPQIFLSSWKKHKWLHPPFSMEHEVLPEEIIGYDKCE